MDADLQFGISSPKTKLDSFKLLHEIEIEIKI
jgi:hypothetical protein